MKLPSARIVFVLIAGFYLLDWSGTASPSWGQETSNPVKVLVPNQAASGVRKGADVYILGELAGSLSDLEYAADGHHVELELNIQPGFLPKIVRTSRVLINRSGPTSHLEIIRTSDLLGMDTVFENSGLTVAKLLSNGPADKAGVQLDDRIISINKTPTKSSAAWARTTSQIKNGDRVEIKVSRDNKPLQFTAVADVVAGLAPLVNGEPLDYANAVTVGSTGTDGDDVLLILRDTVTEASEFMTYIGAEGDELMSDAKAMMEKANNMMDTLDAEMEYVPGTMMEVREMMKNAGQLVEKVQQMMSGVDDMMAGTSQLMNTAQCTMSQANEMVSAVRSTRIMSSLVNRSQRRSSGGGRRNGRRR